MESQRNRGRMSEEYNHATTAVLEAAIGTVLSVTRVLREEKARLWVDSCLCLLLNSLMNLGNGVKMLVSLVRQVGFIKTFFFLIMGI